MSKFTPFKTALCSLALIAPQALAAQEQENPSTPGQIPDPSTYQGSTVLQQQSDQQDQSFRQQQQQQSGQDNNYGTPQSYQQYGSSGRYPPKAPSSYCNDAMERNPSFARLRGLVRIGGGDDNPSYFAIDRYPTAVEKPVLMRWLAARKHCLTLANGFSPEGQAMNLRAADITNRMILSLVAGKMTYGSFNYTRAHNAAVLNNYLRSH